MTIGGLGVGQIKESDVGVDFFGVGLSFITVLASGGPGGLIEGEDSISKSGCGVLIDIGSMEVVGIHLVRVEVGAVTALGVGVREVVDKCLEGKVGKVAINRNSLDLQ